MQTIRKIAVLGICAFLVEAGSAGAQTYPSKPIRVVTSGAGGGGDTATRLVAQGLYPRLGQQVIVDNRPSGVIPGQVTSQSPPDGYTLLFASSTLWIGPLLRPAPYDPIKDFVPVTLAINTPNVLVVPNSMPVRSVSELISLARARPGELNYGSVGSGASSHLGMELLKSMAGLRIERIAYKSGGAAHAALMAGEVQMMMPTAGSILSVVKSGKLRALAVTGAQRSPIVPDLPTVASGGVPGFEAVSPFGFLGPAGVPAEIVNRLHTEIAAVLKTQDVNDKLTNAGVEVVGAPGAVFGEVMKSERARFGKVIKDAGITAEE